MIENFINISPWMVLILSFFLLLKIDISRLENIKHFLPISLLLSIFIIQGDSILLGERARLEFGDGEMLFHGYFPYLAKLQNSLFLHDIIGGVDRFSVGRIGGAIFSGRLFLIENLPFWLVVVLLRVVTTGVAFFSMYLIVNKTLKCSNLISFVCGFTFASCFDFNTSMTFLYALSISSVPLLLYFFLNIDKSIKEWVIFIIFSIIYVIFSDPFFWLPSLSLLTLLSLIWLKPKNYVSLCLSFSFLLTIWLLNYSENILAVLQNIDESSRPANLTLRNTFPLLFKWLFNPRLIYNSGGLTFVFIILFSLYCLIKTKDLKILGSIISVFLLAFAPSIFILFPWEKLGLNFLNSYSWYTQYFSFPLSIIMFGFSCKQYLKYNNGLSMSANYKVINKSLVFSLAITISMIFQFKMHSGLHMLTRGNLSIFQNIDNLNDKIWYDGKSRVIGIPTKYDPNISSSYGLPSLDGGATFIPKTLFQTWTNLILKNNIKPNFSSPGLPTLAEYNKCCNSYIIDNDLDFEMLRLFNVRYIISFKELISKKLNKVSGPEKQIEKKIFHRLFDKTENVYIYQINKKPLGEIYTVENYLIIEESNNKDYLQSIKEFGLKKYAIFEKIDPNFKNSLPKSLMPLKFKFKKVKDGYVIDFESSNEGLLLLNIPPLRWWVIKDQNGNTIKSHPANLNQLAIIINSKTRKLKVQYDRPTFFKLNSKI